MGNCFEPNSAGYEERLDPVAQRKKTDAPTPDDLVQDKPNDQLASSGDGGISGGEKDRSRGGGVEARNVMFENSSELEPTEPTSPLPVDDESHDHLPDDRTPEETPVITDTLQEETPEIEIPCEETPVATVEEETPEVEIPHAETPVVTVQEESPEIEIPHEENPVVTDTLQKETPEIEIPQEETPEVEIPHEETPVVTDTLQKETPEIEIPQEETPEVEQSEEVTPVIETSEEEDSKLSSPNKDVPVINGHQEEVPIIDQEQAVNEDVPEISDHMYEYQNGSGNVDNAKSIAHEETPLISSTNGESNNDDTNTEDGIFENENGDTPTIKVNESQSEQTSEQNGHLNVTEGETKVVQVANGDDVAVNESQDSVLTNGVEETHSEEADADTEEALHENGVPHLTTEEEEEEDGERGKWRFPPILEDFDLMETEADPDELESMFHDDRLIEIHLDIKEDGPGLGISIVGGNGSPSGDLPIIIKRVLPGCLAEQDGRLKPGDELVAVNEKLLVGVSKVYAINALSNNDGLVRLLVLQDY